MRAFFALLLLAGLLLAPIGLDAKRDRDRKPDGKPDRQQGRVHEDDKGDFALLDVPDRRRSRVDAVSCIGDGQGGPRVQLVYGFIDGQPSRYAQWLPVIRAIAQQMDAAVQSAARETGGERVIRFATEGCAVSVLERPFANPDDFWATVAELGARHGLIDNDRKYLVFSEGGGICGFSTIDQDDRPGWENEAARSKDYAVVGAPCWQGGPWYDVALHELLHGLGAVQNSAPHSTGGFHCNDPFDVMCYDDGGPRGAQTDTCPRDEASLLDCNDDDYFHAHPPPGSYPFDHWNVVDSPFLDDPDRDTVLDCGDCEVRQTHDQTVWLSGLAPNEPYVVRWNDTQIRDSGTADAQGTATESLHFGQNHDTGLQTFVLRGDRGSWAEAQIRVRKRVGKPVDGGSTGKTKKVGARRAEVPVPSPDAAPRTAKHSTEAR